MSSSFHDVTEAVSTQLSSIKEDDSVFSVIDRIKFLSERVITKYAPVRVGWDFGTQVENWGDSILEPIEKYQLMKSLKFFTFLNQEQYEALYEEAFTNQIIHWVIDVSKINPLAASFENDINTAINETCFCALTDSMDISGFCKTNHLNQDDKPIMRKDWDTGKKCLDFISTNHYSRMVILEDFVGTGDQSLLAMDILSEVPNFSILFAPLAACPQAILRIREYLDVNHLVNIDVSPVYELPWDFILDQNRPCGANSPHDLLNELMILAYSYELRVKGSYGQHYPGALGYKSTGALFAKYNNCPDNTLPLYNYHGTGTNWQPLFPRVPRREKVGV
jgi:hypothetical protein